MRYERVGILTGEFFFLLNFIKFYNVRFALRTGSPSSTSKDQSNAVFRPFFRWNPNTDVSRSQFKEEKILSMPVCLDHHSRLLTRTTAPFQSSGYASQALPRLRETRLIGQCSCHQPEAVHFKPRFICVVTLRIRNKTATCLSVWMAPRASGPYGLQ